MYKLVGVRHTVCVGFRLSERGKENENVLSEERPKGLEEMKTGVKRRSWEEVKGDDKTDKERKTNRFD
jgi:acyl-CoA-binding protein